MHPEIACVLPATGPIAAVEEPFLERANLPPVPVVLRVGCGKACDRFPGTLVGPAGECHGLASEKQLAMSGDGRPTKSARFHVPEIRHAQGAEVQLPNLVASLCGQPVPYGRVCDGLETGEIAAPEQTHRFTRVGSPHDGSVGCARVGGSEFQGLGADVVAPAQPDRRSPRGLLTAGPPAAQCVPRRSKVAKGSSCVPGFVSLPSGAT